MFLPKCCSSDSVKLHSCFLHDRQKNTHVVAKVGKGDFADRKCSLGIRENCGLIIQAAECINLWLGDCLGVYLVSEAALIMVFGYSGQLVSTRHICCCGYTARPGLAETIF
jgi:hypothetical protein